ncbi:MAG: 16S rRNA (guanine(966)-N(2))-methyltransferase RsmD [Oscillospiraceae bacterium]|nr:16S rRNA (guanine(966)-N(2))-methyltransferase RsmD [Oscillospiraceae bacterium]
MRVITGKARGRRLREPEGMDIRPTTDRVKEAMFNICQFDLEGRRVLDLFGGTGQLGIEAASRGASEVTVVDRSREALALIRENVRRAGLPVRVCQSEALRFLERCGSYDLIFLDPPYDSELTKNALFRVKTFDILTNGGIIICESRVETALPELEAPYRKLREYRYGRVKLTTYTKDA